MGVWGQSHHKAVRQSWHSPAQEKKRPWLLRVQFSQNKSCQRWHKARMMEIIGQWRILYSSCWMQAFMAMASSIETAENRSFHPICSRRSTWMAAWFLRGPNLPNLFSGNFVGADPSVLKLKQRKIQWAICLLSSSKSSGNTAVGVIDVTSVNWALFWLHLIGCRASSSLKGSNNLQYNRGPV